MPCNKNSVKIHGTAEKERVVYLQTYRECRSVVEPEQYQMDEVRSGAILVKRCSQDVFRVKELIK